MPEQVRLADGTDAWVMALERTDRARLAAEFEQLSPESRRLRFLSPVMRLSDHMLTHLVDDVDGVDHVALVLFAESDDDVYDPVAIARMVRYADLPDAADLAVTVKDAWQGRGVASALLPVLVRKRPEGVTRVVTEVLSDNPASLAMLRRLGPMTVLDAGHGVSDVEVMLPDHHDDAADEETPPVSVVVPEGDLVRLHPVLQDPRRSSLRTRDQVCPWLT